MARFEGTTYGPMQIRRRLRAELDAGETLIAWGVVQLNPLVMSGFGAMALSMVPVFGPLLVVAASSTESLRAFAVVTDERLLLLKIDRSAVKVREVGRSKNRGFRGLVRWIGRRVGVGTGERGSRLGDEFVGDVPEGVVIDGERVRSGWGAGSGYESGGAGVLASVGLGRVCVELDESCRKRRPTMMSAMIGEPVLFVVRIDLESDESTATDGLDAGDEHEWAGDEERVVWGLGKKKGNGSVKQKGGTRRSRRGKADADVWGGMGVGGSDRGHRARRGGSAGGGAGRSGGGSGRGWGGGIAKVRVQVRVTPGGSGRRLRDAFFLMAGEDLAGA